MLLLKKGLQTNSNGGRQMLCKLNHEALFALLGDKLIVCDLPHAKPKNLHETLLALFGYIDGLTPTRADELIGLIKREELQQVFVDGSNLGGFVSKLKRSLPQVEVITFFHNVEARFFWGAFRSSRTFRALAVFVVNYFAERKAVHFSDKRICLSKRDSNLLRSLYGKDATHIAPIALIDKFSDQVASAEASEIEPFALFVGGNFYANREGINWFVRHVVPRIKIKVYVIGQGMQNIRQELEVPGKVSVIGPVESLGGWYRRASFVIAPIFDGSGMKTKVAEALMFGKSVLGTPEAFIGYEDALPVAGEICHTADEFVAAINRFVERPPCAFDEQLRSIYQRYYSYSVAHQRLKDILEP